MAIFWIVFLFVKNSNKDTTNTIESTAILSSLFKFIFGEVVTQLSSEIIALSFTCQFSECQIPSASEYAIHRGEMLKQL